MNEGWSRRRADKESIFAGEMQYFIRCICEDSQKEYNIKRVVNVLELERGGQDLLLTNEFFARAQLLKDLRELLVKGEL